MANIKETATWQNGVYQIEPNDSVIGGENGIANRQAKELASRTQYLKQEQDKLKTATAAATTAKTGTVMLSSSTTSSGETKAATEKAAKTAFDRANAAYNLANGKANANHTHTMANITDLAPAMALKAPLASPTFTGAPKAPTPAKTVNDTTIATTAYVKQLIADLIGGAPAALDTLKEIATALGNNANLSTTLMAEIGKKATKATTLAGYGIADFIVRRLTSQEHLDDINTTGIYYQGSSFDATLEKGYPDTKAGTLIVLSNGSLQLYIDLHTKKMWARGYVNSIWSPWVRLDALDSVPTVRVLTAGNGLTGGGNLSASRTFTLGTPSTLGASSTNAVTAESHTHAIDTATTSRAGIVQLSSSTTGTSTTRAATESAVKALNDAKANLASPAFTGAPTAPTAAQTVNNTQIATTAFVKSAIAALVGGAPAQLDTLKEIATALGNKANLEASLLAEIGKKANASHTHTSSNISDFNAAVTRLFTQSFNSIGWTKMPNGLILQWGFKDYTSYTNEKIESMTFPVSFPGGCLSVSLTRKIQETTGTENGDGGALLMSTTKVGFKASLQSFSGSNDKLRGFVWFAIGY